MKVKLNILERIAIMNYLQTSGTYRLLSTVQKTGKMLLITEEERKKVEMEITPQGTFWNKKYEEEREFDLPRQAYDLIKKRVEELDKQGTLTLELVTVYEKFVGKPDEEAEPIITG